MKYRVEVKITHTTPVSIDAENEDDAIEKANDIVHGDGYAPDTHLINHTYDRETTVFIDYTL